MARKVRSKAAGKPAAQPPQDNRPPQPLIDFMMTGWTPASKKPAAPVRNLDRHQARRKALSKRFPGEVLVVPTGHEKIRANDSAYPFRAGSDFFYLTGNKEPDCVLVLLPKGRGHREVLFVEPEVDRSTPAFFTDRARGALWVGARLGLKGTRVRYGVAEARGLPELPGFLDELARGGAPYRVRRGLSAAVDAALPGDKDRDGELASALAELRLYKDDAELAALRRAIRSTRLALEALLRTMKTAKTERELEAAFDAQARVLGDGVGFPTIVASGEHAAVLHWTRNDGRLARGDLLLIDCGVEGDEVYTADISRTFPIRGKFTKEQRAIYELVTDAQTAAIAACKPGNDFVEPHRAATRVLVEGLERLGILREPAEEALREDRQTYKRYTLHNVSHMLGLDVHDNAAIAYRQGKLAPGMVLTIEPGLYFQPDDETVPKRYRGLGIRVEEDVVITRTGARVLSSEIPRLADDVEAWIAKLWE